MNNKVDIIEMQDKKGGDIQKQPLIDKPKAEGPKDEIKEDVMKL